MWLPQVNNTIDKPIKPPESLWQLMQTRTSITEKAKQSCPSVRLELLSERWETTPNAPRFIREIYMWCDDRIGWYARAEIPQATYNKRAAQFDALHTQPLATILYNDSSITRSDFVYAYLTPSSPEYQWAVQSTTQKPDHLWARKSTFWIDEEPLYLLEVFFKIHEEKI